MTSSRDVVLARVRAALGPAPEVPVVPRGYRQAGAAGVTGAPEVVERFCERVAEYRATVTRIASGDVAATVARLAAARGAARLAVPPPADDRGGPPAALRGVPVSGAPDHGLPLAALRAAGLDVVEDDPPLSPRDLDALDGVLTGSALAIAETGTIVLDGGPASGRRALTLVPDWHVCVVRAATVVAGVPDAVAALAPAAAAGRPVTLVSGPSATSDIELERVEGVHGPRALDVLVTTP